MANNKNKELAILMDQAKKQGWVIIPTNKGHYKWMSPVGNIFFSSSTPSDGNAVHQIRRDLARRGFIVITNKPKGSR